MKWESHAKKKKFSIKRLLKSFCYAIKGILTSYKTEQNLIIHTFAAIIVLILCFYLKLTNIEFCLIIFSIGLVISLELVNTAIEYTVDMAMPSIHPLAKIAKDVASGAVLIGAFTAFIIGIVILLPKIIVLI